MKNVIVLILLLFLYNCAKPVNTPTSTKSSCKINLNKAFSKKDPEWFNLKENLEYNYVVKNKETSGDRVLAQTKNLYVSEIILANQIASDFMSCEDQNKALYTIRNADLNGIKKIKNGKIIKNLTQGYKVSNNETIEDNGGFTNYLKIIKLKK
tara:strand:+ start:491 stop:949 length:459 start_codon:yes stop_codon:yes gene_type:complete